MNMESRTYCFIDAANLFYGGEKTLGWKIDYLKLIKYLRRRYKVNKVFYYAGLETLNFKYTYASLNDFPIEGFIEYLNSKKESVGANILNRARFYKKLQDFGYILRLKPVRIIKLVKIMRRKKLIAMWILHLML